MTVTLDKLRCYFGLHRWTHYRDEFKSTSKQSATFEWKVCETCEIAVLLKGTVPRRINGKEKAEEAQAQA